MSKQSFFLICALCVLCGSGSAQTLTQISDTLYNADGTKASGRIVISWDAFTSGSVTVDGGTLTYSIPATGGTAGAVNVSLYPNAGATPAGTSYRARYFLANAANYTETWVVPATGPVKIADVRVSLVPSPTVTFNPTTQLYSGSIAKGTLLSGGSTAGYLGLFGVGANGLCLVTDSTQSLGIKWGSCAAGGTGISSLNGLTTSAQTFANDTNVTISSSGSVHTLGWSSALGLSRGGTNQTAWTAARCVRVNNAGTALEAFSSDCGSGGGNHNLLSSTHPDTVAAAPVLGDLLTGNSTPAWSRFAGNITTAKQFLTQTGTGTVSAAPAWAAIADGDIPSTLTRDSEVVISGTANEITSSASGPATTLSIPAQLNISGKEIIGGATPLKFEGTTDNNIYTQFTFTDPTVSTKTVTFPNADSNTVQPDTGAANNFLTAISAAGVISKAQPAFTNLSGSATASQVPNLESLNGTLDVASGGTGTGSTLTGLIRGSATAFTAAELSGDATTSGSNAVTVVNLPDGVTQAGHLLATNIAAPVSPAAGKVKLFADSTDLRFHDKNAAGTVATTVVADAGAANNFLTAISAAVVISKAQPAFTNISGTATAGQVPNLESLNGTLDIASGGTGTGSTLTGLVRGSATAMTAAELSGDVTTSGSNAATFAATATVTESRLFCSDAGVSDTYACSLSPAIASYVTGTHYRFKANTANTGVATINFNALGAITIKKVAGGITTDLADNDIRAGQWVEIAYDGTNMQMQSTLGNVPSGSGTVNTGTAGRLAAYPATGTTVDDTADVDSVSQPGFCQDAGTTDTYACNLSPAPAAYTTGTLYRFKANTINTGAATINFNALGAKTIVKNVGVITATLSDGDICAGQWITIIYDGTNMQLASPPCNGTGMGYTMQGFAPSFNPVDADTGFWGCRFDTGFQGNATRAACYMPKTGTVKKIFLEFIQTAGSAETSTIYFRLNNTTDTVISSAIVNNATVTTFNNVALSIAVTAGDYFEFKWITPTWVTNPTSVGIWASVYIE